MTTREENALDAMADDLARRRAQLAEGSTPVDQMAAIETLVAKGLIEVFGAGPQEWELLDGPKLFVTEAKAVNVLPPTIELVISVDHGISGQIGGQPTHRVQIVVTDLGAADGR